MQINRSFTLILAWKMIGMNWSAKEVMNYSPYVEQLGGSPYQI